MAYSRAESDLVAMALDRCAPSGLAVEAMVSGVLAVETFPAGVRGVDVVWAPDDMPDL